MGFCTLRYDKESIVYVTTSEPRGGSNGHQTGEIRTRKNPKIIRGGWWVTNKNKENKEDTK